MQMGLSLICFSHFTFRSINLHHDKSERRGERDRAEGSDGFPQQRMPGRQLRGTGPSDLPTSTFSQGAEPSRWGGETCLSSSDSREEALNVASKAPSARLSLVTSLT